MVGNMGKRQSSRSLVSRLATILAEERGRWRDRIFTRIWREVPSFDPARDTGHEDLLEWLIDLDSSLLSCLQEERPLDSRIFDKFGRACADSDIPLVDVHATLWILFEADWREIIRVAHEQHLRDDEVVAGAGVLWSVAREASTTVVDAYRSAAVRRAVKRDQRSAAQFRALLADAFPDPDAAREALISLRLESAAHLAVVVASASSCAAEALPNIEEALNRAGFRSAWQFDLNHKTGIVAVSSEESMPELQGILRRHADEAVGLSSARSSVDLTRAYRQAWIAMESVDQRADVALFGDRFAQTLVAAAPGEIIDPLVDATLAGLRTVDDAVRTGLLETFLVWVDHGGDVGEVARLTFRHPNTIRYRLRRIETLTGRSLKRPADLVDLTLAARLAVRTRHTETSAPA